MTGRHGLVLAAVAAFAPALAAAGPPIATLDAPAVEWVALSDSDYQQLIGKPVMTADGQLIGRVSGVIRGGRLGAVRQLVMTSDSAFGLLAEPLAVAVEEIGYDAAAGVVVLAMTEAEIRSFH